MDKMMIMLGTALGLFSGIATVAYTKRTSPEVEQSILSLFLILAAVMYILFALVWAKDTSWLATECFGLLLYTFFVVLSKIHSPFWLSIGWAAHPLWDALLHMKGIGKGHEFVPQWYVVGCMAYDLIVAGYIAIYAVNRTRGGFTSKKV